MSTTFVELLTVYLIMLHNLVSIMSNSDISYDHILNLIIS